MPKRNIVWITVGAVVAVLLWKVPESLIRRDALYNQFAPMLDVLFEIRKHYVEETKEDQLLHGAIDGMLNRLDPYSEYYDAGEYEQFRKRTEGEFTGIGIQVSQMPGGGLEIDAPIEGSPAFHAGLRAGDRITKIDGKRSDEMSLAEGVELISGRPGTNVTLTIFRPVPEESFERTITRGVVTVRTVRGWARSDDFEWDYLIDPVVRIGYVRISAFERHTAEQLDEAVRDRLLLRDRMRGLIIDLRDNPGGLLPVVVDVADRFLSSGVIVTTRGRQAPAQPYAASPDANYPHFPIVVLINHGSASAAEILSGALRDHNRATLVGERSFGKGSVQEVIPMEGNRGALKLTTAYYYLPKGERIHGRGVVPDKIIDLTTRERAAMIESQMAVYSTARSPATTQTTAPAATSTAPSGRRISIGIDRQLREALSMLRQQLSTQPSGD